MNTAAVPKIVIDSVVASKNDYLGTELFIQYNVKYRADVQILENGICYDTKPMPDRQSQYLKSFYQVKAPLSGSFKDLQTVLGLKLGTKYFFRVYIRISTNEEFYSSDLEYTTPPASSNLTTVLPDVNDGAVTIGTSFKGNFELMGPLGVCLSAIHAIPTVGDSLFQENPYGTVTEFRSVLTQLPPGKKYYVRAFARHADSLFYGASETFTTGSIAFVPNGSINGIWKIIGSSSYFKIQGVTAYDYPIPNSNPAIKGIVTESEKTWLAYWLRVEYKGGSSGPIYDYWPIRLTLSDDRSRLSLFNMVIATNKFLDLEKVSN